MRQWIRNLIKDRMNLYDISDLQIGGHCGCCGRWISDVIVSKEWSVSICDRCKGKTFYHKPSEATNETSV